MRMLWMQRVTKKHRCTREVQRGFFVTPSGPNDSCNTPRTTAESRIMGLEQIYPRKKLSQLGPNHRIFPYLLRNVTFDECDHVWCADLTYIPMRSGFLYLVAIMDWHSRRVLSWRLSNTLDTQFCLEPAPLSSTLAENRLGRGRWGG